LAVQAARLLYELSHAQRSGVCVVGLSAPGFGQPRVELYRGWVHAVDLEPAAKLLGRIPPRGEDALTLLLKQDARWSFDEHLPASRRGACPPFHPAAVVRNLVDPTLGDTSAWRTRLGSGTLVLATPPHPSCLGHDEKPLIGLLQVPRGASDIDTAALCPPSRAARLIAFLEAVGALRFGEGTLISRGEAFALLELPDGASADEIKRAYRRLARALHPDAHPTASADEIRELERRFGQVSAAYRRLV
jgi:hypothetical protein